MIYIYFKFSNPIQSLCDTTWRKFVAGSLKSVLVIYLFIYLFIFSTLALKPNLKYLHRVCDVLCYLPLKICNRFALCK